MFQTWLGWYNRETETNWGPNMGIWRGRNVFELSPTIKFFLSISEEQHESSHPSPVLWNQTIESSKLLSGNWHTSGMPEGTGMLLGWVRHFHSILSHVEILETIADACWRISSGLCDLKQFYQHNFRPTFFASWITKRFQSYFYQ